MILGFLSPYAFPMFRLFAALASNAVALTRDLMALGGLASVAVGLWGYDWRIALIVLGLFLVALSIASRLWEATRPRRTE